MNSYVFFRLMDCMTDSLKNLPKKSLILDVGCGPGSCADILPYLSKSTYVALDISPKMVHLIKHNYKGVEGIIADAECLPFRDGTFNTIISGRMIKFLNTDKFLTEANSVLNGSGSLSIMIDSGDLLWVRILEKIGLKIDPDVNGYTMRVGNFKSELMAHGFKLLKVVPVSIFPQSIFSNIPQQLYSILEFFDKPLKNGRVTFILANKSN